MGNPIFIAADPEVIVLDEKYTPVPCVGLLSGTKDRPSAVEEGTYMEDNVMAEFTIVPAATADDFVNRIDVMRGVVDKLLEPLNYYTLVAASHSYDKDQLASEQAQIAGCDPDYDAWTGQVNPAVDLRYTNVRTAAGHVHIDLPGITDDNYKDRIAATKVCDLLLGLPLSILSNDLRRRELYGKAGAHRPKPYGIEYRTLDNFWIIHNELVRWVFNSAYKVATQYKGIIQVAEDNKEILLSAINYDNKAAGIELYNKLSVADAGTILPLPKGYIDEYYPEYALNVE